MSIRIRAADLDADRTVLIKVLARFLTPLSTEQRYDWLYLGSPYGRPRTWFAVEETSTNIVGVASAFPRRVYIGGQERQGWVLGDFCISDRHRSLGPALQLQRACLSGTEVADGGFCYDLPSQSMTAVYKRLGVESYGHLIRLAKPLTVDRKMREKVRFQLIARGASVVANAFLKLRDANYYKKEDGSATIAVEREVHGPEFTMLAQEIGDRYGACIQRSTEYINWRYMRNPLTPHEMLTARVRGRLVAYAVFTQMNDDATLVDLFGYEDMSVLRNLLGAVCEYLRPRGVATLSAPMWEAHPWKHVLLEVGFVMRETSPVFVYPHTAFGMGPGEKFAWFLMQGDRDS